MSETTIPNKPLIARQLFTAFIVMMLFACTYFIPNTKILLPLVIIYAVLIYFCPKAWLLILPTLTIAVDLTPLTGRFIFNELDILLLVTISLAFLKEKINLSSERFITFIPILIFLSILCWLDWTSIIPTLFSPSMVNPYYGQNFSFKIVKSALYGFFLAVIFRHQLKNNIRLTIDLLFRGAILAAFVLFLTILWERGTLGLIYSKEGLFRVFSSLFNFSDSYRVTGMMSDMHTGGEAIDGVFAVLIPITLAACFYYRHFLSKITALVTLACVCYAVLVGYTRSTYAAIALAIIYFCWHQLKNERYLNIISPSLIISILGMILANFFLFTHIGFYALIPISLMMCFPFLQTYLPNIKWLRVSSLIAISAIAIFMMLYLHFNSRWITPSAISIIIILLASFSLGCISQIFVHFLPNNKRFNIAFISYTVIFLSAFVLYIALNGTQITQRFETINKDLQGRFSHWSNVINSANWNFSSSMFGQRAGSYPLNYAISYPDFIFNVGSIAVKTKNESSVLVLGGGDDMKLGQRILLQPNTNYQFTLKAKTHKKALFYLAYCERNILTQQAYNPNCVNNILTIHPTHDWHSYTINFNSKTIGNRHYIERKPTLLFIQNKSLGSALEIQKISLTGIGQRFELIKNNEFNYGLDQWFFYDDFQHLPWHIKNMALEVFYNSGTIGLIVVILIFIQAFRHKNDFYHPLVGHTISTILLTWILLGFFGSPIDSTRASWLFFTLFFALSMGRVSIKKQQQSLDKE